ncbi:MAG: FAD-dependent oxidoreductase [Patescibacteria group bacterium]
MKNNIFILKKKIKETDDVVTLKFLPEKGKIFSFFAGQFVMVELINNELSDLKRAYTISSPPRENFLSITVKKIGRVSGALHDLKTGDKIKTNEPQGFFYPNNGAEELVFLAGGVGITPFYSIIKDFSQKGLDKNIHLLYSNKTKNDIVFFKELEKLSSEFRKFKITHFLTREKIKHPTIKEFERINSESLKKHLKFFDKKHYFICGPVGFVNGLWAELKKIGVKEDNIFTEAFY